MDCLFCKIIKGEIPSMKIYEDDILIAFLDINPLAVGHTLIVPKKHYKDITDIDNITLIHIIDVAKMLKEKLENNLKCDGISLIQNNGDAQEIKHFHLHLKPFYKNNKNMELKKVYELLS